MVHQPDVVHYLPIATTVLSVVFLGTLVARARERSWAPHLVWWAVGVFFYGVGTTLESAVALFGNSVELTRLWYWAGAVLGGYPLATGSVYLLFSRRTAHWMTGVSMVPVVVLSVLAFLTPIDASEIDPVRLSAGSLEWQWIRNISPVINIYAAIFLCGGALHSSVKFFLAENKSRSIGTALICVGGLLPGIGGSMARQGLVEYLYIGELAGIILIWIGYELCIRGPKPRDAVDALAGSERGVEGEGGGRAGVGAEVVATGPLEADGEIAAGRQW